MLSVDGVFIFLHFFQKRPEFDFRNPLRKLKKIKLLSFNERRVKAMSAYGRNIECYPDPTATKALSNVARAEKKYLPLVAIYDDFIFCSS